MISCNPVVYFLFTGLLLLVPLDWLLSAMTAALVHEFCHIIAVKIFGGQIRRIHFSITGCRIECSQWKDVHKILSILAGPAGSFSLLLFRRVFPKIAVCGLLQGLYNLLPVLPLDGGRILQILLDRILPGKGHQILSVLRYFLFVGLFLWLLHLFGNLLEI